MALKATLIATGVLLFFIVLGELILKAIHIPLPTFQIAGGIVLFLFALTMIFGESKPETELSNIDNHDDTAVFPLAMPSLASPGAILAVILLTENSKNNIVEQALTTSMMLLVLLIAWIFMVLSTKLFKYIGNSGAAITSRVMGLILSAVAVSNILEGIKNILTGNSVNEYKTHGCQTNQPANEQSDHRIQTRGRTSIQKLSKIHRQKN